MWSFKKKAADRREYKLIFDTGNDGKRLVKLESQEHGLGFEHWGSREMVFEKYEDEGADLVDIALEKLKEIVKNDIANKEWKSRNNLYFDAQGNAIEQKAQK